MKTESNVPAICFACEVGHYHQVVADYVIDLPEGESLTIPGVMVLHCDKCGEEALPPESSAKIESFIAAHQETLSAQEVNAFLKMFDVDQTAAAEALGLGAKTIHRWARGTQQVSRSMGYFLRAIMAHPDLFDWIRNRSWKNSHSATRQVEELRIGDYWSQNLCIRFQASRGRINRVSRFNPNADVGFNAARALFKAHIA